MKHHLLPCHTVTVSHCLVIPHHIGKWKWWHYDGYSSDQHCTVLTRRVPNKSDEHNRMRTRLTRVEVHRRHTQWGVTCQNKQQRGVTFHSLTARECQLRNVLLVLTVPATNNKNKIKHTAYCTRRQAKMTPPTVPVGRPGWHRLLYP